MISGLGGRFCFNGVFSRWSGDGADSVLIPFYECKVDIQQSDRRTSYTIQKEGIAVYFPMEKNRNGEYVLNVKKGDYFECNDMYGNTVNGDIKNVYPSRLGFAVCYLEDKDFEEDLR